ncbi:ParB N-terminal domain-containing protein [Photorhabdus antumapuensis]|uniref:transcriptional regulator n=1 Tax=Photorhabdus antumapuensis TaxID=2862867 RepID=UPI001CEC9C0A|nr:transcriptional regulator [Photorhabdus antumapuensis]MCA6220779.1 transcriptional regulator [Photorhabdus antumapuensis]
MKIFKLGDSGKEYEVSFEKVSSLRQSEEVDSAAVKYLSDGIVENGIWNTVIPTEYNSGWIMDGNHRYNVAKNLGLKYLPVAKLCYTDTRVSVLNWKSGESFCLKSIGKCIKEGRVLPYKTTKHIFYPALPEISIPLDMLWD